MAAERDIVPDDWWPEILRAVADARPLDDKNVLLAEISNPWGEDSYFHFFSALVPNDKAEAVLAQPGGIGHDVTTSGPHPIVPMNKEDPSYVPRFWVDAGDLAPDGLEPLTISWQSFNQTYLAPDQGFLMTYGLIPRLLATDDGLEIRWDDLEIPREDIVVARPLSYYDFPLHTRAFIRAHRDYLQDYATLRGCQVVQVYFAERWGDPSPEVLELLDGRDFLEFRLPGRRVSLQIESHVTPSFLAKVWGVRPLLGPSRSPVLAGRWEYGELAWPGIEGVVSKDRAQSEFLYAYVSDSVLGIYEDRPGFTLYPESGGVKYGGQWSSGRTQRIGRDLIQVELKRLYEGTPPEVVRTWHRYAVAPPKRPLDELRKEPNVATRTRAIAYGLAELGESLSVVVSHAIGVKVSGKEIVGLSRQEMNYHGWWTELSAERVARHVPANLTKDAFFTRAEKLHQLVVEGLQEGRIRQTLVALGEDEEKLKKLGSIKLLGRIVDLATVATTTGHFFIQHVREIRERLDDAATEREFPLPVMGALNELRLLGAHRGTQGHRTKLRKALALIKVDEGSTVTGWGIALDTLYDRVIEELDTTLRALWRAIENDSSL